MAQVGCVGDDGQMLIDVLKDAGVDVEGVRTIAGASSGHAVIQVNDAGENAIVIAGGTNRLLTTHDIDAALSGLGAADWLLLQNEINALPEVLSRAKTSPARVAFNVAPVDGRESEYDLDAVDLLIVNEHEARALVPAAVATASDATVARWLQDAHPAMDVVLTAGAEGLHAVLGGRPIQLPALSVQAVDETAAGDAFIGYLLAGLLEGLGGPDALALGAAAGALAVTAAGAASSIPDREAVDALRADAARGADA